jgi:hypothetical protein
VEKSLHAHDLANLDMARNTPFIIISIISQRIPSFAFGMMTHSGVVSTFPPTFVSSFQNPSSG